MIARARTFGIALLAALALGATLLPASAASLLELNFYMFGPRYDAVVPLCDDPAVLSQISGRFANKESAYWNSNLQITGIERVRQVAFRPWAENTIPRRFCSGTAFISDGKRHTIHYAVNETGGWIAGRWGVEWCVVGLDRNWAFSPACRMARP
jgi:hypothetical protein